MKFFGIISAIVYALFPSGAYASALARVCTATGNCRVCDIVATAVTLGKWLIAGAGGLALLVIVWAAFGLVTSAGNPEKISAAKKQITGSLLGIAIVMAAFQLVMIIIALVATPSQHQTFEATQSGTPEATLAKNEKSGSLERFLGTPWWSICSESDLRAKNGNTTDENSTAHCKFWGDGTPCNKSRDNICINGECVTEHKVTSGPKKDTRINTACQYLVAYDSTYGITPEHKAYKCQDINVCNPGYVEKGLCPGAANIVCCAQDK
jgi:hypothetical protein